MFFRSILLLICGASFLLQPLEAKIAHFQKIEGEFAKRWQAFRSGRHFKRFVPGESDAILMQDFEVLHQTRKTIWEEPEYAPATPLIEGDLVRSVGCFAFAYNNTVPYYNCSTMEEALACEGPRSKDLESFFHLICSQHVTHLVRLTDAFEGEVEKCYPYWEGLLSQAADGRAYLDIPNGSNSYSVQAYEMGCWRDNQGVDPSRLLALVLQVREEVRLSSGLLLVHCSAGVGRTGTFLAALAIVDALDRGMPFSIEEIVYRLSLQRRHSVGKAAQYITLHRLAEIYQKYKEMPRCCR